MTINVPHKEFNDKWSVAPRGKDNYTDGNLTGTIVYEDDTYVVIKLNK